jgi:hypothetical protein
MKKSICAVILSGLVAVGAIAPPAGESVHQIQSLAIAAILQAHNAPRDPKALEGSFAEAVRLTSNKPDAGAESPSFFEWKVSVYTSGPAFRRHKVDHQGAREQIDLFDGRAARHLEIENGKRTPDAAHIGAVPFDAVEFGIKTFGLIPILRQLSDPAVQVVYRGRTPIGHDWFTIASPTGDWSVYSDRWRLIRRVEIRGKRIEYAGYGDVDGIKLPFIQRVSDGKGLVYELVFTRIAVNPKFPPHSFSLEGLPRTVS